MVKVKKIFSIDVYTSYLQTSEADINSREKFPQIISEGRKLTGLSLKEAAQEFNTAIGIVSRWENAYSTPPAVSRRKIISFYRKKIQEICKDKL